MPRTMYYVDPVSGSNGNAGTSDGAAWSTLEFAIANITRDATNGDQINCKSNGTHSLAATLNLQSYATDATESAPLVIAGYTATADDGGVADIDCTGFPFIDDSVFDYLQLRNLDVVGGDASKIFESDRNTVLLNCYFEQTGGGNNAKFDGVGSEAWGCHFKGAGASTKYLFEGIGTNGSVYHCLFEELAVESRGILGIRRMIGCVVLLNSTATSAGVVSPGSVLAMNNIIFNAAASTQSGLNPASGSTLVDNYIEGYSGTGGKAISCGAVTVLAGNRWFDCETGINVTNDYGQHIDNQAVAGSGLTDAANGDISLTQYLRDGKGFPQTWRNFDGGFARNVNVGAVQNVYSAGGGGGGLLVPRGFNGGFF